MIRMLARPMLASVFVIDGVSVLRNPKDRAAATAPVVSRVAKKAVEDPNIPTPAPGESETVDKLRTPSGRDDVSLTVVRALAAAKIGAGALFAIGKLPRTSALVLAATHVPTMAARFTDTSEKTQSAQDGKYMGTVTDAALLGALFIAAADTQGKPGLAWRWKAARGEVAAAMPAIKGEVRSLKDVLESTAHTMGKDAREVAQVVGEKSHAASTAAASEIEAGLPKLQDAAKNLQAHASSAAEAASEQISKASANLPDADEIADKLPSKGQLAAVATTALAGARARAEDLQDRASKASKQASKRADKARKKARKNAKKQAKKLDRNIDLRGQAQQVQEQAQALAEQAADRSAPLMEKVREAVDSSRATATARTAAARYRAEAARAAAEGDKRAVRKNMKAAKKAAKQAAKA